MFEALHNRQAGQVWKTPRSFELAAAGSLDLVKRLELRCKLEGHSGCVNTVTFSEHGDLLVSGSDDMRVMLWNWYTGRRLLSYRSGHSNNIFQARPLPKSNNSAIVTCAADGQVRVGYLRSEGGSVVNTNMLAHHGSRAHKLALDPETPSAFYSCGEDGRVFHYDLRCPNARQSLLVCNWPTSDYRVERMQLHSIHCNPLRPWQFAVSGSDIFVRVYDQRRSLSPAGSQNANPSSIANLAEPVRKLAPKNLRRAAKTSIRGSMAFHVTCANFSQQGELLATYNDENIYLFKSEGPWPAIPPLKRPLCGASGLSKRHKRSWSEPDSQPLLPSQDTDPGSSSPDLPNRFERQTLAVRGRATQEELRARAAQRERAALRRLRPQQPALTSTIEDAGTASASRTQPSEPDSARPLPQTAATRSSAEGKEKEKGASRSLQEDTAALNHESALQTASVQKRQQLSEALALPGENCSPAEQPGVFQARPSTSARPQEGEEGQIRAELTASSPTSSTRPPNSEEEEGLDDILQRDGQDSDWEPDASSSGSSEGSSEDSGAEMGPFLGAESFGGNEDSDDSSLVTSTSESDDSDSIIFELGGSAEEGSTEAVGEEVNPEEDEEELQNLDDEVLMTFSGHRNYRTVKGVSFLGESDEYVMSGSDDGHIYIWTKSDGILRQWLAGDVHVVNCLEPNPAHPMSFATSGIEDDIKLWTPTFPEVRPISSGAVRCMAQNRQSQGNTSSSAQRLLLRLQRMAQAREASEAGRRVTAPMSEVPEAARAALRAHAAAQRAEQEPELPGYYSNESPSCTIS